MPAHVLLVEDDPAVRDVVLRYLERDGHRVSVAGDGQQALETIERDPPDLLVLDLMLPVLHGHEILRRLRARDDGLQRVPVVMLTALAEEEDRVAGLTLGADDYLTKPFSPRELALRVGSVLRRTQPQPPASAGTVSDGSLTMDLLARTAHVEGRELMLTAREFDLLAFLVTHAGRVWSRADLLAQVWGWSFGDHSTVTVHVKRLRAKLDRHPALAQAIVTVYGTGYRYDRQEVATP